MCLCGLTHMCLLTLCPVQAGLLAHQIPKNLVGRGHSPPFHRREPEYSSGKTRDLHKVTELNSRPGFETCFDTKILFFKQPRAEPRVSSLALCP